MTPTRDQLDAVLTRSSAGVTAMTGDLDDPEERARALDWLEKTIREAVEVRQALPPPTKGSHESDLGYGIDDWDAIIRGKGNPFFTRGGEDEYYRALAWSRTPDDRSST